MLCGKSKQMPKDCHSRNASECLRKNQKENYQNMNNGWIRMEDGDLFSLIPLFSKCVVEVVMLA